MIFLVRFLNEKNTDFIGYQRVSCHGRWAGRVRSSAQMPEKGLTPVVWRLNSSLYGPFRAVTSSNKFRHAAVAAPLPAQAHARTPFRQFAPESHPSRRLACHFQSIREQKGSVLLPNVVFCSFRERKWGDLLPDCFAVPSYIKTSEAKNQLWKTFPIFVTVRALWRVSHPWLYILDESVFVFPYWKSGKFHCTGIGITFFTWFGVPCDLHSLHTGVEYCLFVQGLPEPPVDRQFAPHFFCRIRTVRGNCFFTNSNELFRMVKRLGRTWTQTWALCRINDICQKFCFHLECIWGRSLQ